MRTQNYKLEQAETISKNVSLDKIFGPKNIGHGLIPILSGSAPLEWRIDNFRPQHIQIISSILAADPK